MRVESEKREGREKGEPTAPSSRLVPPSEAPPLLFQRLRWRLLVNSWRALSGRSLARPLTILGVSLAVWALIFAISWLGFDFLQGPPLSLRLTAGVVVLLIDVLFLALGVLLIFSSGLILYGGLFASAETAFLLSKPAAADRVFAYKFQTALAFSSVAFLVLGSPILLAYGVVVGAPWHFYLFLPAFFLGYVLIPGSAGGMLCLLIVNFFPRRRKELLFALAAAAAVPAVWLAWSAFTLTGGAGGWQREAVGRLLGRFTFASSMLMPGHWVGSGLQAAALSDLGAALYHLALVWSNGLFLYLLTAWLARRLYRRGYDRLASSGGVRRPAAAGAAVRPAAGRGAWLDAALGACLFFVRPETRLLIVKDFKTFRRDPLQYGQVLIFVGLMVLYIMNIRRMFIADINRVYQNLLSVLNLFAVALLLCTYTGRFVYPLLSLEGRKMWLLGLLPVRRDQLLWGKFAFAATGALVIALPLVLLSDWMLGMSWPVMVLHAATTAAAAAGLSGLSVGLGACLPNFRETDPSKIAVGFGGTLNLVAGLGYLMLLLLVMAGPWHLQMGLAGTAEAGWVVGLGAALGLALAAAAVVLPLRAGVRALRRMEF
jgi:ABC-2 type transport system permease protein